MFALACQPCTFCLYLWPFQTRLITLVWAIQGWSALCNHVRVHMYARAAVCMYILLYTGRIQGQEQACVAMVKMKSKMQSCKESLDWLRSHAWDCDACCHLANRTQAEQGLLLRGVAWNRISWVFSLPLSLSLAFCISQSVSGSLIRSFLLLALPLPSLTPSTPPSFPRTFFFLHFYTCKRGKSTCWKIHWIFHPACCVGLGPYPKKPYIQSGVFVCLPACMEVCILVCVYFIECVFLVHACG